MDDFSDGIVSCNKARGDICINAGKLLLMFDKGTNDTSLFFSIVHIHNVKCSCPNDFQSLVIGFIQYGNVSIVFPCIKCFSQSLISFISIKS